MFSCCTSLQLATNESGATAARSSPTDYSVPEGSTDAKDAEEEYAAPGSGEAEASERTEDGYAAPAEADYGAPTSRAADAYGAPVGDSYSGPGSGFPFSSVEAVGRQAGAGASGDTSTCPGDSIEACVEVCPGTTARVYGACVNGCANRCPE